ncbi:MAG: helix-turn-helix transcriptional regulator [Bacteroidota bacterium]
MQRPGNDKTIPNSFSHIAEGSRPAFRVMVVQGNPKLSRFLKFALEPLFQIQFVPNVLFGVEALLLHGTPDLIILTESCRFNQLFYHYILTKSSFASIPLISLDAKLPDGENEARPYHVLPYPYDSRKLYDLLEQIFGFNIHFSEDFLLTTDQVLALAYPVESQNAKEQWIAQFYQSIDPLLKKFGLTLQDVADELCISLPHLHRKVKDITAKTPMALIKERRLQKALEALKANPRTTVKYVAYSVGYKSAKNFSKNFKSRFGTKPSDYLKK